MNRITNNVKKFRAWDYVTDGRDVFYVLEAWDDKEAGQYLHVEDCRSGNTYSMCEYRSYRKCKKPPSCKQELAAAMRKRGLKGFGVIRDIVAILRKHGNSIHY